jgi:phage terminase large subunit-like protein
MAKDRMPERTYRQEWLAEFIEDGGIVFRHIDQAATAIPQESAQAGHQYVFGVDFGRLEDYTVVSVIDVTDRALVHIDRFNTIDWTLQVGRIAALYDRFQPTTIVAERNSMGDPVINMLYERDLPVLPFTTTNATKQTIIDGLALAFEQSQIRILKDNVLINELQAYEATQLPSGLVRYGAPSGSHDDCVMSLALAWHGASGGDMEFA